MGFVEGRAGAFRAGPTARKALLLPADSGVLPPRAGGSVPTVSGTGPPT